MKALHNVASSDARSAALERLWSLAASLSDTMQAGLADRGLTLARAAVLWELQRSGSVTQNALSAALRVTARNITGLVDALEADGLVARTPHPSDRRATLVVMTEKGATLARAMKGDQDKGAQYLFKDVTQAELAAFDKVVNRLLAALRDSSAQNLI